MKRLFLILCILIILLLIVKPFHRKSNIVQNNVIVLKKVYNDSNLYAPIHKFLDYNLYEIAPRVSINDTISIKSYFEQNVSTIKCRFEINTDGVMVYKINNEIIWNSEKPRKINHTPGLSALLKYADENEWKPVFTTKRYNFSIAPLSITKHCGKIIWTFFSGWDTSNFSKKTFGDLLLISDCRKYRLALLENSDLVVLKVNTEDKKTFKIDLNVSLIENYKNGHT